MAKRNMFLGMVAHKDPIDVSLAEEGGTARPGTTAAQFVGNATGLFPCLSEEARTEVCQRLVRRNVVSCGPSRATLGVVTRESRTDTPSAPTTEWI